MREVRCKNLRFFFNFVEITNYRTQYLNTLVCPHSKKSKNASFSGQKLHFTDKINHKVPLEFLGFFSAYGMRLMETFNQGGRDFACRFSLSLRKPRFFFNQKKRYYEKDFAGGPFLLNQSNDLSHTYIHTYIYMYIYMY